MKPRKNTFEEELVNIITPYVVQPEQGTAEFIIIEVLNKINDKLSYTCNKCLNEMEGMNIEFEWVKAHDGNKWNEFADTLATVAVATD